MSLKLRIIVQDGKAVSANSTTEELLTVLSDSQQGAILLDNDDEETLRGWLLIRADELESGATATLEREQSVCIGKSADGRAFVRDNRGDWPPLKPDFSEQHFK